MSKCGGWYARHWFTLNSRIGGGDPSPVCIRCGTARPKPLTEEEWAELRSKFNHGELHNKYVVAAVSRHFGGNL